MKVNNIVVSEARGYFRSLPDKSVHCIVSSPPYWNLRAYPNTPAQVWGGDAECEHAFEIRGFDAQGKKQHGFCKKCGAWHGHLGLEPTPELYTRNLCLVLQGAWRVLRDDGTMWLNLGTTYAGSGHGWSYSDPGVHGFVEDWGGRRPPGYISSCQKSGLKPRDLVHTPWMIGLELMRLGWYLRSDTIWNKIWTKPESQDGTRWEKHRIRVGNSGRKKVKSNAVWKDCPGCERCTPNDGFILRRGSWRPTRHHDYILMLTKKPGNYCDKPSILQPANIDRKDTTSKGSKKYQNALATTGQTTQTIHSHTTERWPMGAARNLGSVWTFSPGATDLPHYAAFPPRLPELCIAASTSPKGVCPACGAPWARVISRVPSTMNVRVREAKAGTLEERYGGREKATEKETSDYGSEEAAGPIETLGWRPTCDCPAGEPIPAVVCDPFMGSGTTALVAQRMGRYFTGCDLSADYVKMAYSRLRKELGLFAETELDQEQS